MFNVIHFPTGKCCKAQFWGQLITRYPNEKCEQFRSEKREEPEYTDIESRVQRVELVRGQMIILNKPQYG